MPPRNSGKGAAKILMVSGTHVIKFAIKRAAAVGSVLLSIVYSRANEVSPFFCPGVMRVWVRLRIMVLNLGCAAAGA